MAESPGIVPESLEDSGGQHCFDTAPEELDKILDQCHTVLGLVFVVKVVKLFKSGAIAGKICNHLYKTMLTMVTVQQVQEQLNT